MDPDACLDRMIGALNRGDNEELVDAGNDLAWWLAKGGFAPSPSVALEELPTLSQGQAADLKLDTGRVRVWLSRCGADDGETRPVQVERLSRGRWEDVN